MFLFILLIIGYRAVFATDISPQESIIDDKIVSAGFPVKERYICNVDMDYLLYEFQNLYIKPGLPIENWHLASQNKRCWKNIALKLGHLSNPQSITNENYSNCNKMYHEQLCGMAKAQLILPLYNTCQDQYEIIRFWNYNCKGGNNAGNLVIPSSFKKITKSACQEEISETLDRAVKLSYLGMSWISVITLAIGWVLANLCLA